MAWSSADEQTYNALNMEEGLSTGDRDAWTAYLHDNPFRCVVSTMVVSARSSEGTYLRMKKGWWADPFGPNLLLLIFLPFLNLCRAIFFNLRSMVTTRNDWASGKATSVRLEADKLTFDGSWYDYPGGSIPYSRITSLGHYANGVVLTDSGTKVRLESDQAPSIFVALRHFAPGANVASGLIVPPGFSERCSAMNRSLNPSAMRVNPPATWKAQANEFRPPVPTRAIVGIVLAILIIVILFG